jgi:transposase
LAATEDFDDARLEALLFPPPSGTPADQRPMPDWAWVHRELRRPDVTLALLWEEYRAGAADGFGYFWFCDLYRAWAERHRPMPAFEMGLAWTQRIAWPSLQFVVAAPAGQCPP